MCLTFFYHPEDLLALGLVLAGAGCTLQKKWLTAGFLLGLACCTQQFAILALIPLFVVIPGRSRIRYAVGAATAILVVDLPFVVATSGRAIRTIALGSSRVGIIDRSAGGTVLWESNWHGPLLFFVARIMPIAVSGIIAWWAYLKLGERVSRPIPLMSIVATGLILRLVFEVNLFGYYFMAASVALLLLDVVAGSVRGSVLAWIGMVTIAFNPVHEGFFSNLTGHTLLLYRAVPIVVFGIMVLSVIYDLIHRRYRLYKVAWIVVALLVGESQMLGMRAPVFSAPHWLWQITLVPIALVLALRPLLQETKIRANRGPIDQSNSVTLS
jgi:hypothetical protein